MCCGRNDTAPPGVSGGGSGVNLCRGQKGRKESKWAPAALRQMREQRGGGPGSEDGIVMASVPQPPGEDGRGRG